MVQDEKCDESDGQKSVICQRAAATAGKTNKVRAVVRKVCAALQQDADEDRPCEISFVAKRSNLTAMHIARASILPGEQL